MLNRLPSLVSYLLPLPLGSDLWVVCPRRLLAARYSGLGSPPVNQALQEHERSLLLSAGLPRGVDIGLWAEVALKPKIEDADINYHFDYRAAPLVTMPLNEALQKQGLTESQIEIELPDIIKAAKKSGYFLKGQRDPASSPIPLPDISHPFILEVMTASTSGSDTESETDIRSAFRNAILSRDHTSPGINKRQVWGRMVTQLFAKTALAQNWNGRTIWIIQDELLRNIELTTRLRTNAIMGNAQQNISLVIMRYDVAADGSRKMSFKTKIDGDAGIDFGGNETFTDILLPKTTPPKIELLKAILRRRIGAIINL